LNDFQFAGSLAPLAAAGLVNLTDTLPENERYTYAYEGNLQALDHMWVSSNLLAAGAAYDVVHANAEFITQVSDHDPVLMTLGTVPAPVPEPATWLMMALGVAGLVARRARRCAPERGRNGPATGAEPHRASLAGDAPWTSPAPLTPTTIW
jgi:hypothetical protein